MEFCLCLLDLVSTLSNERLLLELTINTVQISCCLHNLVKVLSFWLLSARQSFGNTISNPEAEVLEGDEIKRRFVIRHFGIQTGLKRFMFPIEYFSFSFLLFLKEKIILQIGPSYSSGLSGRKEEILNEKRDPIQ